MMRLIAGLLLLFLSLGAAADTSARPVANSQCFQALQGRLNDMSDRLTRLENQASSQGILSLLNQLETLESEVAKLRGAQDELAHRQQLADQRQQKVLADFDRRLRQLQQEMARPAVAPATSAVPPAATAGASVPAAVPTAPAGTMPAAATPAATVTTPAAAPAPTQVPPMSNLDVETKAYEAALNLVRSADYNGAVSTLSGFLKQYPNTKLAGNATYWLGFSYYALGDYKDAQLTQQRLLDDFPQHPKVPDAMIGLARADIQLGQMDQANQLLNRVIARYPNTTAAEMAQKMQTLLK